MRWLPVVVTLSFCLALAAWANDKSGEQNPARAVAARRIDGEQVYKTNCTRCHNTPPQLTERQVRAVVRHMRVRANIPADRADAVLQYLLENARKN